MTLSTLKSSQTPKKRYLVLALLSTITGVQAVPQLGYTVTHDFTVNDVQGGHSGAGVASSTYAANKDIICGLGDSTLTICPPTAGQPFTDTDGNVLYPVDSTFGFIVSDFVGAADRLVDQDYNEGYAGPVLDGSSPAAGPGVALSNTSTSKYKTKDPYGTWCAGLGGVTVKCSTEHYVVMEHVLSCNETVPYTTPDPTTAVQNHLHLPGTTAIIDNCANNTLDNNLFVVNDFVVSATQLTDTTPGVQMQANESTVRDDIAVGGDYTITLKDDGKPLYRWGNAIKRPTDIRVYAQMALPVEWTDNPNTAYAVTSATLSIRHTITNNPNDQIRPEDMENEAAIGRLPTYVVSGSDWQSSIDCYEGDGHFIPAGTYYKNAAFAQSGAFSSDLTDGLTNAWYTSTNRNPFEIDPVSGVGPRWRLTPNKYGQDIPGLEIADNDDPFVDVTDTECNVAPPFDNDQQKYKVGDVYTTTINLLDFAGTSPLATSLGWIDASANSVNIGEGGLVTEPNGMSLNGLPLTNAFDLAIYIKGDKKPVKIYDATLVINWDNGL